MPRLSTESHLAALRESMADLMNIEHRTLLVRSEAIITELKAEITDYKAELDRAALQIRVLSEGILKQKARIEELEREIAESDSSRRLGGGAWNGDIP